MARHVHDFTDEKQFWNFAGFHGFRGKFIAVNAAHGYLGFLVTLGTLRCDRPVVRLAFEFVEPQSVGRSADAAPPPLEAVA